MTCPRSKRGFANCCSGIHFCWFTQYDGNVCGKSGMRELFSSTLGYCNGRSVPVRAISAPYKVSVWGHTVGIYASYSPESQIFLDKLEGWALDQVRHVGTQAYTDHIKSTAAYRGREIVRGTERFLEETETLARKPEVLEMMRSYQSKLKWT